MKPPCPTCRTIHCARAVNRFEAHTPTRYMPSGGGVTRPTRTEAMADVCAARTHPPAEVASRGAAACRANLGTETDQPEEGAS